jgi:hypothetical protein
VRTMAHRLCQASPHRAIEGEAQRLFRIGGDNAVRSRSKTARSRESSSVSGSPRYHGLRRGALIISIYLLPLCSCSIVVVVPDCLPHGNACCKLLQIQTDQRDWIYHVMRQNHALMLSALILPYFSTLKGIFHPGQRGFLLYPTILRGHNYSIYLPYTNYHIFYYLFFTSVLSIPSCQPTRRGERL